MKSLIKKILKEEYTPTETDVLYYEVPKKLVDQMGFKLHDENDVVYIHEIHFDTQNVLFSFFKRENWGEEIHYEDSMTIPGSYDGFKTIPIKDLPKGVINLILRRLDPNYLKYLKL